MREQKTAEALTQSAEKAWDAIYSAVLTASQDGDMRACLNFARKAFGDFRSKAFAALSPKPDRPMLSDERIKAFAESAGFKWLLPLEEDDDTPGGFPGAFDMASMEEMRAFVQACIRADREGQS